MTALGIALTVAVLVTVMALTQGLNSVFAATADPLNLMVLRRGTDAELTSSGVPAHLNTEIIRDFPGISHNAAGEAMVSPEGLTVVSLVNPLAPKGMNVTVRGLKPLGLSLRPMEFIAGRAFDPSLREVIVGESIARRYPDAALGHTINFGKKEPWTVVGVFRSGDSAANSEIWTSLDRLSGDFERAGDSSSLLIHADNAQSRNALIEQITKDQRLTVKGVSETSYYEDQTRAGLPLQILGITVAVIMAIGSAFAATNTMYAAVSRRTREIGTLRALGFNRGAILISFLRESVFLALLGGLLGVLLALPINGMAASVGNFNTFSDVTFKFKVGANAIAVGLLFSATIGALGGFLPAYAASRKGIVQAMRDL